MPQRDPTTGKFLPAGRAKCINHLDRPVHGNGLCANCWSQDQRDRNTPFAQRQKESARNWQRKNSKTWQKKRYDKDPITAREKTRIRWASQPAEKRWEINLKAAYGINAEEYYKILDGQDGCCAICYDPPSEGKKLVVDHRHNNDPTIIEIRGLLCGRCNTLVGWIDTTKKEELERAIIYAVSLPITTKIIRNRRTQSIKAVQGEQELGETFS